jgi:Ca2+:H+ antiporter
MNWLLLFVPIAIGLELLAPDRHLLVTFTLVTHPALFAGFADAEEEKAPVSVGRSVCVLAAATVAIAWMSEIMAAAIEPMTHEFGLIKVFVGVFVVAILGPS